MRTFNDIYNTILYNFTPQPRNCTDLGIILSKLYEILNSEFIPFDLSDHPFPTDETTIIRLIKELEGVKTSDNRSYTVSSEGVERLISDVRTHEMNVKNPKIKFSSYMFISLKANLQYLIDTSREGLILTKKKIIIDNIQKLENKNKKINYLNSTLTYIIQNKDFWDQNQYEHIIKFLNLELSKWNKLIETTNSTEFKSTYELHNFIVKLIKEKLVHNIQYLDGYKVFWRDESCSETPKNEIEIQPFIKSILKPYCDNKKIKIHRESAIASGQIDLTFTYLNHSICLEIKKAQHQNILRAINSQLTEYMIGCETEYGIYMILWYKTENGYKLPKTYNNLDNLISEIKIESDTLNYKIIGLDCSRPISPSKK